jgi:hypothetical protein
VSTRVVQLPPDRSNVSAITAKAPWWDHQEAAGTKHGAWGAYIDAMRAARCALPTRSSSSKLAALVLWPETRVACRGNGAYCALLIDPDGYVVDADRMTPIIWDASGRLRYAHAHMQAPLVILDSESPFCAVRRQVPRAGRICALDHHAAGSRRVGPRSGLVRSGYVCSGHCSRGTVHSRGVRMPFLLPQFERKCGT